jgi:glycosyltransferase involved in cell wall biosynthesis
MFLHIFLTPFQHESRVLKECRAASDLGWEKPFMVAALHEPGLDEEEELDNGILVWRVNLKTRGWPKNLVTQLLKYLELMARVVARMRREDLTVIHTHSVSALPVGVVLKWLTGAPVVYDAHELESETNGLSRFRSKLTRWAERMWIRGADRSITVCDSIADWYADAYSMPRPTVIRNVPLKTSATARPTTVLRDAHDVPHDAPLFLYQGSLAPGRGIEALLDIFTGFDSHKHLVLMGYGPLEEEIRDAQSSSPNIHFQPAVPPDQVLNYTASADAGLCLIENTCLSYYYSLPNKLFEYLLSGLPVLVNDMPEQRRIVERFQCGWVVPESLDEQKILFASIGAEEIAARKEGAANAAESFDWEEEANHLRELYLAIAGNDESGSKSAETVSPHH